MTTTDLDAHGGRPGSIGSTARSPLGPGAPAGVMLVFASLATAGVGLWLFWVAAMLLPARDPDHVAMWRLVAAGLLAYAALSGASVATGARHALLRWSVGAVSLAAIALGLYGIADMLRRADAGGHFEGHIVLMGVILAGHGLSGILYALLARRTVRSPRAA